MEKCTNTCRYYPFTYVHHKSRSCDAWLLRYKVQRTKFFVILDHFLPFDPPNNPKIQNFEKIKKYLEILSFYTCVPQMTIMMYGSGYIRQNISRQNFFVILGYFLPFYPRNNPKNLNFEKMKKAPGDIIYTSVP